MTWSLLWTLLLAISGTLLCLVYRRRQLSATRATLVERAEAKQHGSHEARLQYPFIDLSRCVGCGTCIDACPEEGVLGLVYGQAAVIHGAQCVGHGRCAEACPVAAIQVTLGDLSKRRDIPVLDEHLQADGVPGLYLAGEVTGYALVRTAITQGTAVAEHVAGRVPALATSPVRRHGRATRSSGGGVAVAERDDVLDLCIVGAGPAGLACSLAAKKHGLSFLTLERERMGGTVAQYPRRKLVMTQPVELPLHGRLSRSTYEKEELVEMWEQIAAEHDLPIRTGQELVGVSRGDDGVLTVETKAGRYRAHNVCLCLGRRGTPRKLGVAGEDLPKVAYSLMDADSYRGRRILVVGGGDSAVEAAVALAEQPGNRVSLSYRKPTFSRIKARNRRNLDAKVESGGGQLRLLLETEVREIRSDSVVLSTAGADELTALPNDEVFVFAGGVAPFKLLEQANVSFDPERRAPTLGMSEQGTGIVRALLVALLLTVAALGFALWLSDYYALGVLEKTESAWHDLLKPTGTVGLLFGIAACVLILTNLAYLLRRSRLGVWLAGSLQYWLSLHVVTGLLAMLLLLLHGGMEIRDTSGGLAFLAVVVLVISGAVGRYFYSYLPRAANGNELALDEVKGSLAAVLGEWDREGRALGDKVQAELVALQTSAVWHKSLPRRIAGLFVARRRLRESLARIEHETRQQGVAKSQVQHILALARRIHRAALMARHYEDLFGLLSSWRFVHRWLALAMVLLAVSHIAMALRYARFG